MSKTKERIIRAISAMNEQQPVKVWELIPSTFRLSTTEGTEPSSNTRLYS